jgi:hypothetical protein
VLRAAGWVVVGVLLAASAYYAALALGAGSGGAGSDFVGGTAFFAMVAAFVLAGAFVWRPAAVAALLAPSVALVLLCYSQTYDPYYAPLKRRYSEDVSSGWLLVIVLGAVGAGLLTWRRPRIGAAVSLLVIPLLLVTTALASGGGH